MSRDLHFITSRQKSRVDFVVTSLPGCDSFSIHIFGAIAENEREMFSARVKAGLAAAKARGKKLGTNNLKPELIKEASARGVQVRRQTADDFATKVKPRIDALLTSGKSLRGVATELKKMGLKTARGKENWTTTAVKNVVDRIA